MHINMNGLLPFAYLPIIVLIFLMTKKKGWPSYKALPFVAVLTYLINLIVFAKDPNILNATVVMGLLLAWTPLFIIAGAILLFKTMEAVGSLATIRSWLNTLSGNKIAQLMIVGWAFVFLIEGASGFGTPAALAAPILVGLGFPPVRVAILCLIMNCTSVAFGAVGTPTWFGFSTLHLSESDTLNIGFLTAVINSIAALVIPFLALMFVVKVKYIIKNSLFIILSILSTLIPYIFIARLNYEFPSLVGGFIGLCCTILFARYKIGLSAEKVELHERVGESHLLVNKGKSEYFERISFSKLIKATFPLWGTILLLLITRIPQLRIREFLLALEPSIKMHLGSFGNLSLSAGGVISLSSIFKTSLSWSHSLLFVPSIIPFGVVTIISLFVLNTGSVRFGQLVKSTFQQLQKPILALSGALVFVNFMMTGGDDSIASLIGNHLASISGQSWQYFASFLGALGTFFSGSNTISNLTFGAIQLSVAERLNIDYIKILAIQSAGGSMGSMISISNIVAVASVLGLANNEGYILKRTALTVLVYGAIIAIVVAFL